MASYFPRCELLKLLLSDVGCLRLLDPEKLVIVLTLAFVLDQEGFFEVRGLESESNFCANSGSTLSRRGLYKGGPVSRSVGGAKTCMYSHMCMRLHSVCTS